MCLCCHPVTSEKIDNEPDFRNKLLNRLSAYYNSNENWFKINLCIMCLPYKFLKEFVSNYSGLVLILSGIYCTMKAIKLLFTNVAFDEI